MRPGLYVMAGCRSVTLMNTMQTRLKIVLYDTEVAHDNLLPLTFTRPAALLRVGILTIREKWERLMPEAEIALRPVEYLEPRFGNSRGDEEDALFVAGNVVVDSRFSARAASLPSGHALSLPGGEVVAFRGSREDFDAGAWRCVEEIDEGVASGVVRFVFDIFRLNATAIESDFRLLCSGRVGTPLPASVTVIGDQVLADGLPAVFLEEGASVEGAIVNVTGGPVYIGRDAQVMEGSCLRGPLAVCDSAKVRMGTKIYGGTTLGPWCKAGGEIDNVVMLGYSNKAHDGYLGNAVIGEWCNIGAGVNASNLKNDYSKIRIWNYATRTFMRTDLQFCGLIMGDHSKIGVNCMLNTATVMGVGVNLHGAGFPRVFIPSFSEGSPVAGFADVPLTQFFKIARRVMGRRGLELTDIDEEIYGRVYRIASELKGR